jgi:hemoglobin
MKSDITSKNDVLRLVTRFYEKAVPDELIGHFFTKVVQLDFSTHIHKIAEFWSGLLLGNSTYRGNPMEAHFHLHQKSPMEQKHFDRWVHLWKQTIDENFSGPKAEEAGLRAESIAQLMFYRITNPH